MSHDHRMRRAELALTALLALLALGLVALPALIDAGVNRHVATIVFGFTMVAGVAALFTHTRGVAGFLLVSAIAIGLKIANIWLPDAALRLADALAMIAAFALLGRLALRVAFAYGPVNTHRILGAIAVFVLTGLIFGQLHRLVAMGASTPAYAVFGTPAGYDAIVPHLTYFSLVTLTSLGYGDITPLSPLARALATVEALIGVLYPAVLIGRMVAATHLPARHSDREPDEPDRRGPPGDRPG